MQSDILEDQGITSQNGEGIRIGPVAWPVYPLDGVNKAYVDSVGFSITGADEPIEINSGVISIKAVNVAAVPPVPAGIINSSAQTIAGRKTFLDAVDFTEDVTVITQIFGDHTTNIANTEFVYNAVAGINYAPGNGWISGGLVSRNALDPVHKFDIAAVTLRFTDYTDPRRPHVVSFPGNEQTVVYGPYTAQTLDQPGVPAIGVYIDRNGVIRQDIYATDVSKMYSNDWIQLGAIAIFNGTIYAIANPKFPIASRFDLVSIDFMNYLSPLNLGPNTLKRYDDISLTVTVDKPGNVWELMAGANSSPASPSVVPFPPAGLSSPINMVGVWNDGTNTMHYEAPSPLLDTSNYNPGAYSALIPLLNTDYVNIPILYNPASTVFLWQYPTEVYASLQEAKDARGTFIRLTQAQDARLFFVIAYVTVQGTATDLTAADVGPGDFFNYGVGGSIGASGSSGGGGGSSAPYIAVNTAWTDEKYGSDVTGQANRSDLPCLTYANAAAKLVAFPGYTPADTNPVQVIPSAGFQPVASLNLFPFVNIVGTSPDATGYQSDTTLPVHRMVGFDPTFSTTVDGKVTIENIQLLGNMGLNWDLTVPGGVVSSTLTARKCIIGDTVTLKGRPASSDAFYFEDVEFKDDVTFTAGTAVFRNCKFAGDLYVTTTTWNTNVLIYGCVFNSTLYVNGNGAGGGVTCYSLVSNSELNYSPNINGAIITLYTDRASLMGHTPVIANSATVVYYDAITASDITSGQFPITVLGTTVAPASDSTTKLATTAFVHSLGGVPGGYPVLDINNYIDISVIDTTVTGPSVYQGTWNLTSFPVSPKNGWYWIISPSNVTISGTLYHAGDWLIRNGGAWSKVDNYDPAFTVTGLLNSDGVGTISAKSLAKYSAMVNATVTNPNTVLTGLTYSSTFPITDASGATSIVSRDASGDSGFRNIKLTGLTANSLLKTDVSGNVIAASGGGSDFVTSVTLSGVTTSPLSTSSVVTSWGAWTGVTQSVLANTTLSSVPSYVSYTSNGTPSTIVSRDSSGNSTFNAVTLSAAGTLNSLLKTNGSGVIGAQTFSVAATGNSAVIRDGSGNVAMVGGSVSQPSLAGKILKVDSGAGNALIAATPGTDFLDNAVTLSGAVTGTSSAGVISTTFGTIASGTVLGNLIGTNPGAVVAVTTTPLNTNSSVMSRDSSGKSAVKSFQITNLASGLLKVDGSGNVQVAAAGGSDFLSSITLTGNVTAGPITTNGSYATTIAALAVATGMLQDNAVTYAKMQDVGIRTVVGNPASVGSATPVEIPLCYSQATVASGNVVQQDVSANAYANNFVERFATHAVAVPPSAVVDVVLGATSPAIQEFTAGGSANTQTMHMPAQSTIAAGYKYTIVNNSLSNLQVISNVADGNTVITTLTAVSGRGNLICTSTSSGAAHWDVMAYGATTTTALPLMSYPVSPITATFSNIGTGSYLTALHLYSTMNGSNPGSLSSFTTTLPSFTHLMNGGTYSVDQGSSRTAGTWSGAYTAGGLINILGYTPPIGFTFFCYISVFGSGGTLAIDVEDATCVQINSGSGGKWSGVDNPYVYMLVLTITGANQYAALSNYSV